jgi:hypothetical protein
MKQTIVQATRFLFSVVALAFIVGCNEKDPVKLATTTINVEAATFQALTNDCQSYASVLYELAFAKHVSDHQTGLRNILTVHNGREIRKYGDGEVIVISLPAWNDQDRSGLCLFAEHYNLLNIQAADEMVLRGNTREARKLYQLLAHFDRRGNFTNELADRLSLLARLEGVEPAVDALQKFRELYSEYSSRLVVSGVDTVEPLNVTNLLSLP